jgi:hypothetical protein
MIDPVWLSIGMLAGAACLLVGVAIGFGIMSTLRGRT